MRTLVASTQIAAPPSDVFGFFEYMNDRRYCAWHPQAHRAFHYVSGDRIERGAVAHAEEVLHGDAHSYDVRYTAVVPDHLIEFHLTNPLWRFLMPRVRLEFRDSGDGCQFVQKIVLRSGPIGRRWKRVQRELAAVERHMREECANLRDIVENDRVRTIDAGDDPAAIHRSPAQQVNVRTS